MRHPYQSLALGRTGRSVQADVLFAACGSQILGHELHSGTLLSTWPESSKEDEEEKDSSPDMITIKEGDEPVKKRRKMTKAKRAAGSGAMITKLVSSRDGRHLIGTTGEDKSVLVFAVGEDGRTELLNNRQLSKRPCGIALTPENDYILVADKFGDVYSLPLHPSQSAISTKNTTEQNGTKPAPKPFKVAASNLTVHSGRNRKALEAQLKNAPVEPKQKDSMDFEHELLLGHVSMLTDIASVEVDVLRTDASGVERRLKRSYILTADRDEHIRVSRGRQQAWIIENYCFGHTQFISKLCLPRPNILVSGGGDNHLFVWDWRHGELLGKLDVQRAIRQYWETQPVHTRRTKKVLVQQANDDIMTLQDSREAAAGLPPTNGADELQAEDSLEDRIAVSGLWANSVRQDGVEESSTVDVFCACERIPALFRFTIPSSSRSFGEEDTKLQIFPLAGNPLDIALFPDKLLVSVDNIHEAGTIDYVRKINENIPRIQSLPYNNFEDTSLGRLPNEVEIPLVAAMHDAIGDEFTGDEGELKSLREVIYGVENLRKRGNEDT